jgi:hypothetical protein
MVRRWTKDALHEDLTSGQPVKTGSERSFGLVFAIIFAAVALRPLLHDGHSAPRWWALALASAFAFVALAAPSSLRPLNLLWTKLGLLLSSVVTPIVLAFLFYGVVTPIGVMMRSLGRDPLRLRVAPNADTYWIARPPPSPPSMKQQF